MSRAALLALALVTLSSAVAAQRNPTEVVDAFHDALKFRDTAGAMSLLSRDLVVYEFGLIDPTLEAYAFTHLPTDMDLAAQTEWTLQDRRMAGEGDQRWVLSSYRVTGTGAGGVALDQTFLETMILTRSGDAFRISHIHWSTIGSPGVVQPGAPPAP